MQYKSVFVEASRAKREEQESKRQGYRKAHICGLTQNNNPTPAAPTCAPPLSYKYNGPLPVRYKRPGMAWHLDNK